MINSF